MEFKQYMEMKNYLDKQKEVYSAPTARVLGLTLRRVLMQSIGVVFIDGEEDTNWEEMYN